MPYLSRINWDYADRLQYASLGGGGEVWYVYDASGERVRKVIENNNIIEERFYLGGYEVYTKTNNGTVEEQRETLHVYDGTKRIAIIETEPETKGDPKAEEDTTGEPPEGGTGTTTIRYQYDNHLGSACLELDDRAEIISYEEYHPFGTTSYRSGRTETEVSLKRYKYVGKERDDETGLYYYGARYYAAWLCRFVSVDPLQHKYPHYTPYQYAGNKPISYIDLDGLEEVENKSTNVTTVDQKNNNETESQNELIEKGINLIGEIPGIVILVDKKSGSSTIRENKVDVLSRESDNYIKVALTTTTYNISEKGDISAIESKTVEWNFFQNNEGEVFTDTYSDGKTMFGKLTNKFSIYGEQANKFIESKASIENNSSAKVVKEWSNLTKNRIDILKSGNAPYKVPVIETMSEALKGNAITSEEFYEIPNKIKKLIDGLSGFGNLPSINKAHTHKIPTKEIPNASKNINKANYMIIPWKAKH